MEFESLPKGWKNETLGNYIDIQSGYAFKSGDFQDNGVPVIKIKNITPPIISLDDIQYVSPEILNNKTQFDVHHKDILISMTGSNVHQMSSAVGKVSRLQYKGRNFLLNQRVGKFVLTNSKEMDYNFLYYLVSTYDTQYELASNASGSANQANINSSMIKSLKRPIPPLPQQQKIASILGGLDDKIELNNQMNKTLETMAKALFKSWFVDFDPFADGEFEESEFGMIPKGWKVGNFEEIMHISSGKRPPNKEVLQSEKFQIPVIGSGGIMSYTNESLFDERLTVIGRVGTLGKIQRIDGKNWVSDNALLIKSSCQEYVYQVLHAINFHSLNRGSTQPLIAQTDIKNYTILIPPHQILELFEHRVSSFYERNVSNQKQNTALVKIRDSLLPKLMSGEIELAEV